MRWSNRIKKYYISKGYTYTNINDSFLVDVCDLSPNCSKKVKVLCDDCGAEFVTTYYIRQERLTYGRRDLCKSCISRDNHNKTKNARSRSYFDELKRICAENEYELVTQEKDFTTKRMNIEFICKKHGLRSIPLNNILNGHICIDCSYELRGNNCRNSPDYVESVINSTNGNTLLNKHDYVGSNVRNLRILCGKCGNNTFLTSFSDYYNANVNQCRSCSSRESRGEHLIARFLDNNNISYIREKKFPDCRDKRELPFDFYIPQYNLIIEFDGNHHYYNVYGENHFVTTQLHDRIKDKYCADNGIHILRIPYWKGNNIETLIKEKIDDINNR